MELKIDIDQYEKLQLAFMGEIIDTVKIKLQESGIKDQELEDITAKIAFSVASIIDDTTPIESDGVEAKPYLAFRGEGEEELIHCGENSYTYEYVYRVMKKLFNR